MYGDDGLWHVRNIRSDEETAAAIAKAQAARSGEEETPAPVADEQAKAVASAVKVPTVLPDAMQQSEELQTHVSEVSEILAGAGYTTAQIQRLADLSGEIALDVPQQPHYDNREESEGILKVRWGSEYDANVKATREAAHKLGPRFLDYVDKGHGNNIVLCEILAALVAGTWASARRPRRRRWRSLRRVRADEGSLPQGSQVHREPLPCARECGGARRGGRLELRGAGVEGAHGAGQRREEAGGGAGSRRGPVGRGPHSRDPREAGKGAVRQRGVARATPKLSAEYSWLYPGNVA